MSRTNTTDRREQIFEVAVRKLTAEGYDRVSVSQITREAGVAKGTFFNYFPTKDHLLTEAFHRVADEAFSEVASRNLAGTDAVLGLADALAVGLARNRALAEPLIARMSLLPAPHQDAPIEGPDPADRSESTPRDEHRIRAWMRARLGEAIPVGVPLVAPDMETLAFALAWTLRGTLEDWANDATRASELRERLQHRLAHLVETEGLPARRRQFSEGT